jgi:predicted MFS family arabinose efflux permease
MEHATRSTQLPAVLWPLMFGNVVIGMGVMVVAGLLNEIRHAHDIAITTAGQLISYSAWLVSLGAPLLAMVVARWDRRLLLVGSMLWYAAFHALAALAPGFDSLLGARVLAMVSAAVFTPQAAACIGQLVPEHLRGRGITFVFLGWSVASVLGTPLGAWIGGAFGWRWTMGLMALLSLVSALWLHRRMPRGIVPPPLPVSAWRSALASPTLMLTLSITVVSAAGQFTLFAYMAPYVAQRFGMGAAALSAMLLVYGVCGFAGNAVVSRWIDRIGPPRAMAWALGGIALGLGLTAASTSFATLLLAIVPWGLGVFASNSSQQARLVALAPVLAPASIALNTSAMYAGQALGTSGGGWLIERVGLNPLPLFGCAAVLTALALSLWAQRWAQRHPVPSVTSLRTETR